MIAIVDYGAGNLKSVRNALDYLGCQNTVAASPREIAAADGVILPGVGEFGTAMGEMKKRGLTEVVKDAAASGKPFLGICLGMQLLFDESEESPGVAGLGVIPGQSLLFPADAGLKIPHMGWNSIKIKKDARLLGCLKGEPYMYFVHSYYVKAADPACVAAVTDYGVTFDASVERGSLFGCQFHPEKSGEAGLAVLRRFTEMAGGGR